MIKKRYTHEEDLVIMSEVKKKPENLQEAFRQSAEKLERSSSAIEQRWYSNLRHNDLCLSLVTEKGFTFNGKQGNFTKVNLKTKFNNFIKSIFKYG